MDTLLHDLRYGGRMLWKHKGLSLVAIISLALGIGANSAIFGVADAILLRPRAVSHPERLVELYTGDRQSPYETTSYPSYLDFRERNQVFTGLAGYSIGWQFKLAGGQEEVEQVWGEAVSGDYFQVLGVPAHLGRTFRADEDSVPGRDPVAVIGYALWQRRFAGDPGIIGRTITVNRIPLKVIGIAPAQYTGMTNGWASEIWVPTMMTTTLEPSHSQRLTSRGSRWVTMVGRMKPGITVAQVRSRFALLSQEMQAAHPEEWMTQRGDEPSPLSVSVLPERETRVHPAMRAVAYGLTALLFGIVNLVLVIACMNLASMLLVRAVQRHGEIAVRLALGAGRGRIVRQLLTESLLLSAIAGLAGALLAVWGLGALRAFMPALPEGIRLALNIQVDLRVVLFTALCATLTGVVFGLAPALHASRATISSVMKDSTTASGRFRTSRLRTSLIVAQVALSLLLLIGAGLVLKSVDNVRPTRLGFASERYVVAPLSLDESYDRTRGLTFYEALSQRVGTLPGVRSASLVEGMPGGFMSRTRRSTEIEGYTPRADESLEIDAGIVGPGYFTSMQVPLVLGRDFSPADRAGAPCVTIVNVAFAERYLGGVGSALGRHLAGPEDSPEKRSLCEIVGVIRDDAWQSLQHQVRPFWATPLLQSDQRGMTLIVNTTGDPAELVSPIRQVIRQLDPAMPISGVQTLAQYFSSAAFPFRLLSLVIGGCGILALLLAAIGIYGTVSYAVAQRNREVGIRVALGAQQADVLKLVVGQGMTLVGTGLGAGLLLSVALTRVLVSLPLETTLLFGVGATDVVTFAGVTGLLGLVGLVGCYLPARRAARVDPMATLRSG